MRISRVSVQNFRNFKNLDVSLSEHAVIVGENRIGKSNFIYALRLILDPSLPDSARQLREEDFWDGLDGENRRAGGDEGYRRASKRESLGGGRDPFPFTAPSGRRNRSHRGQRAQPAIRSLEGSIDGHESWQAVPRASALRCGDSGSPRRWAHRWLLAVWSHGQLNPPARARRSERRNRGRTGTDEPRFQPGRSRDRRGQHTVLHRSSVACHPDGEAGGHESRLYRDKPASPVANGPTTKRLRTPGSDRSEAGAESDVPGGRHLSDESAPVIAGQQCDLQAQPRLTDRWSPHTWSI